MLERCYNIKEKLHKEYIENFYILLIWRVLGYL